MGQIPRSIERISSFVKQTNDDAVGIHQIQEYLISSYLTGNIPPLYRQFRTCEEYFEFEINKAAFDLAKPVSD